MAERLGARAEGTVAAREMGAHPVDTVPKDELADRSRISCVALLARLTQKGQAA